MKSQNIQTQIIFDSGTADYTFSLKKQKYIEIDGEMHYVGEPMRRAVTPLDMDLAVAFVYGGEIPKGKSATQHPIITALDAIWTDDVKAVYKEKRAAEMEAFGAAE